MMRVSKRWNKTTKKILYKNIKFTSVNQREMLFKCLHSVDHGILSVSPRRSGIISVSPRRRSTISEINDLDLVTPPRVILARKGSLRSHVVSQTAQLIESLDFGLRPRLLKHNEPELPCSKQILASPIQISTISEVPPSPAFAVGRTRSSMSVAPFPSIRTGVHIPARHSVSTISQTNPSAFRSKSTNSMSIVSESTTSLEPPRNLAHLRSEFTMTTTSPKRITPSSAMSLDSPRSPGAWQGRWDLRSNSNIEQSHRSVPSEDEDENQDQLSSLKSEEISPIISPARRERPISPILSLSNVSSSNEQTSPYGSWSHRFVSPFLSMITQNIPHLKKLSLCGCHVNGNDFTVMIELLTSLEVLDISYSTLKNNSLEAISRYCRHRLKLLNVSGIFKLGRNRAQTLVLISAYCEGLEKIIALDCPEFFLENLEECQTICDHGIEYVVDHE
jgi:hypothetical protein